MDRGQHSKLSLFLMELIVVIMFFSLSAAVCVRLFASAHILAEKTENLSSAVMWAQNLSEAFTGNDGDLTEISKIYPQAYVTTSDASDAEGQLILFLDKNWEVVGEDISDASFEVMMDISKRAASEVYSDVTKYGVTYVGNAMVGDIKVVDIQGITDDYTKAIQDESRLIHSNTVDVYIGKEGN